MFVESTSQYFFGSSGAAPMELLTELDPFLSVCSTNMSLLSGQNPEASSHYLFTAPAEPNGAAPSGAQRASS